jgi:hypothetical protein
MAECLTAPLEQSPPKEASTGSLGYILCDLAARSKAFGLRPLAACDCGFESLREHGCLSVVNVLCCQVEVSELG